MLGDVKIARNIQPHMNPKAKANCLLIDFINLIIRETKKVFRKI